MADQPKKISAEPIATTLARNDRVVVLWNVDTVPQVRTISANNLQKYILANVPTYADNTSALDDGYPVGAVYKTTSGELRIVV